MSSDLGTVVFVLRGDVLITIPHFSIYLERSGYSIMTTYRDSLREVLRSEVFPKAVVVLASRDTNVYLVNSLIEEFPQLHIVYWYIPGTDSVPLEDARVHLFSGMSPRELLRIIEEI